jgi:tetratricopeptide (TPR) repeat protein
MIDRAVMDMNDKIVSGELNGDRDQDLQELESSSGIPSLDNRDVASYGSEEERDAFLDKAHFILLSCHAAKEDYLKASEYAKLLRNSSNSYYSYFGMYTEVYADKQLAKGNSNKIAKAMKEYDRLLAFFRGKMMEDPGDVMAAYFRVRAYAETEQYVKAEEIANLLSQDMHDELRRYIDECRSKAKAGDGV